MLGTKISPMDKTLVNSIASNVLNIIQSVIMFVIFAFAIVHNIAEGTILENFFNDNKKVLYFFCYSIPFLLAIALKFVFSIINDRNILQSKIVKNGLLFLILNIVALTWSILLIIIDTGMIFIKKNNIITFDTFNKYLYFISSLLCLIIAVFAIVERIRQKNTIHLFFLIFYTFVIVMGFFISVLFLISIYKNEKEEKIIEKPNVDLETKSLLQVNMKPFNQNEVQTRKFKFDI